MLERLCTHGEKAHSRGAQLALQRKEAVVSANRGEVPGRVPVREEGHGQIASPRTGWLGSASMPLCPVRNAPELTCRDRHLRGHTQCAHAGAVLPRGADDAAFIVGTERPRELVGLFPQNGHTSVMNTRIPQAQSTHVPEEITGSRGLAGPNQEDDERARGSDRLDNWLAVTTLKPEETTVRGGCHIGPASLRGDRRMAAATPGYGKIVSRLLMNGLLLVSADGDEPG